EDACLTRTSNETAGHATCSTIVLALTVQQHPSDSVPQALRHFSLHRQECLNALLSPPQPP
ncbi:MAG: hypothetical protein OXD44_12185, partial [Gammaproteobacteria bacterium]|nr:hypothetical protein [Gammaproteobacteria bacterium]